MEASEKAREQIKECFRVARAEGILHSKGERLYDSDADDVMEAVQALIKEAVAKERERIGDFLDKKQLKLGGVNWHGDYKPIVMIELDPLELLALKRGDALVAERD